VYIALVGLAMGTYATKALVDAKAVHPLPESVSFAQGAGMSFQESRAPVKCRGANPEQ
jgi:NADPH:quinone reductase-like Zn-dependent oxidoreductase